MIGTHTVAPAEVDSLAAGPGGADLIRSLWNGQRSRRLRWVWQVVDRAVGPGVEQARSDLVRAARHAPRPARDLLVHPMVGAWAATVLTRETPPSGPELGVLAISVAQRAGTAAAGFAETSDGWVLLPGSGTLRARSARPRLTTGGGRLWIDGCETTPGEDWRLPRELRIPGTPPLRVVVEDVDPHRNGFSRTAAGRLTTTELATWQQDLTGAWRLLTRHAPQRARELAAGLHSLVPLSRPDRGVRHSATSTTMVGVIGLNPPGDPADLAVTLVHEFQHSKLAALHDIAPLYRPDPSAVFRVPWRTGPRTLAGALQGLYAFAGVADTWRALRAEPDLAGLAEIRFAETVALLREPAREIPAAATLTPTGKRFATRLAAAVGDLLSVPVSAQARAAAERNLAAHRQRRDL